MRTTEEEEVDHKAEELEAGRRQADLLLTHPAAPVEPPPPARTPPRAPSTPPPARPSTRSPPRYPSTSPGTAKVVTVPVLRLEADGRQMSPRAANIRALGTAFNNADLQTDEDEMTWALEEIDAEGGYNAMAYDNDGYDYTFQLRNGSAPDTPSSHCFGHAGLSIALPVCPWPFTESASEY